MDIKSKFVSTRIDNMLKRQWPPGGYTDLNVMTPPRPKPIEMPKDWAFLDIYDAVIKAYYIPMTEYYGYTAFISDQARQTPKLLVTFESADELYKQWCQWNVFKRNDEAVTRDEFYKNIPEEQWPYDYKHRSQWLCVTSDDALQANIDCTGRTRPWADKQKWQRLMRRMTSLELGSFLYEPECVAGKFQLKFEHDIGKLEHDIAVAREKIEGDLFLKMM